MRLGHRAEAGSFLQAVAKLIDAQDRNRAMQHAMTVRAHDSEIIEAGFPLLSFHEGRYAGLPQLVGIFGFRDSRFACKSRGGSPLKARIL
jgi:hypothetical protein